MAERLTRSNYVLQRTPGTFYVSTHHRGPAPLNTALAMPRKRSALEHAAGKLIVAIQKEWHEELGEAGASRSESVMDRAHDLLQAAKKGTLLELLCGRAVQEYLGPGWVLDHPSVLPAIAAFEAVIPPRGHV